MSLIGKCYPSLDRRGVTRRVRNEKGSIVESLSNQTLCKSFLNCWILCPGSMLDFPFQMQGKINKHGLLHRASNSSFQRWDLSLIRWVFKGPDLKGCLESALPSPGQFWNYFSCFHFRSKTKTQNRNRHRLLCICFFKRKTSLASVHFFYTLRSCI